MPLRHGQQLRERNDLWNSSTMPPHPRLPLILAILTVPILAGCVAYDTPADLAFSRAELVDWRDRDELPEPERGKKFVRPLLKVDFVSSTNLAQFLIDRGAHGSFKAWFCDMRLGWTLVGLPTVGKDTLGLSGVFWRGEDVTLPFEIAVRIAATPKPITYYAFLDVVRRPTLPSIPPRQSYDLQQEPRDICFVVSGGNMAGLGYQSNIVVLPKEAIEAALRKDSATLSN